jgi:hypothetical protein
MKALAISFEVQFQPVNNLSDRKENGMKRAYEYNPEGKWTLTKAREFCTSSRDSTLTRLLAGQYNQQGPNVHTGVL